MSIDQIRAEAARVLANFNKSVEEANRPAVQLNAADRMRLGPQPIHDSTPTIGSQTSRTLLGRFNPSDINGGSRPGLQRTVHPNEATHEDMMKAIFNDVEVQTTKQRQIRLED